MFSEKQTLPKHKCVLIDFPGRLKDKNDPKKAFEALGGIPKLRKMEEGVELNLYPQNRFFQPLKANLRRNTGLLLKISLTNKGIEHQPLSIVSKYSFDDLFGFQFVPPPLLPSFNFAEIPQENADVAISLTGDVAVPCMTPFTSLAVSNYQYKDEQTVFSMQEVHSGYYIDSSAQGVPQKPHDTIPKDIFTSKIYETLKTMFELKPIHSLAALLATVPDLAVFDAAITRRYISAVAYKFTSGPWRLLLIRLGYDPRRDAHAWTQQYLDLRLPQVVMDEIIARRNQFKTTTDTVVQAMLRSYAGKHARVLQEQPLSADGPEDDGDGGKSDHRRDRSSSSEVDLEVIKDVCVDPQLHVDVISSLSRTQPSLSSSAVRVALPDPEDPEAYTLFLAKRQVYIQLCFLNIRAVKEFFSTMTLAESPSPRFGWVKESDLDEIRRLTKNNIFQYLGFAPKKKKRVVQSSDARRSAKPSKPQETSGPTLSSPPPAFPPTDSGDTFMIPLLPEEGVRPPHEVMSTPAVETAAATATLPPTQEALPEAEEGSEEESESDEEWLEQAGSQLLEAFADGAFCQE